jgi:hypothetical protein
VAEFYTHTEVFRASRYDQAETNIMQNLRHVAMVAVAGLLATACATSSHQSAKDDAAAILAAGPEGSSGNQSEQAGRTSMAHGDAWTATRLFKQAAAANNTPLNRFNLAAGYQNTGRLTDALAIYRTLAVDGQYLWVTPNNDLNDGGGTRLARFNLADESNRRVVEIERTLAGTRAARAVDMKDNIGGAASTQVGGPARGAVTDEKARQLDEKAEAIRTP